MNERFKVRRKMALIQRGFRTQPNKHFFISNMRIYKNFTTIASSRTIMNILATQII